MRIIDSDEEMHLILSSVSDFKRVMDENGGKEYLRNKSYSAIKSFTGTINFDEFLSILDIGSKEIMESIKQKSHKISDELDHIYSLTNEFKYDVTGDFFDVGTMLSGEPEHWLSPLEDEDKKQVEININASYTAKVEHSQIIDGASRIIGIIMSLEKTGVEVKLNLNFRSKNVFESKPSKMFKVSIVAKDYGQGFDYQKLSSLFHTSMFRRGVFRLREIYAGNDLSSSYGRSVPEDGDTNIYDLNDILELEKGLFENV